MVIVDILKRRDGASLVVGVVVAMVIGQFLQVVTSNLAAKLSGLSDQGGFSLGYGNDWKGLYLQPVVWVLLQLMVLELLSRLYVLLFTGSKRK